jgi:hypothetical protein
MKKLQEGDNLNLWLSGFCFSAAIRYASNELSRAHLKIARYARGAHLNLDATAHVPLAHLRRLEN